MKDKSAISVQEHLKIVVSEKIDTGNNKVVISKTTISKRLK